MMPKLNAQTRNLRRICTGSYAKPNSTLTSSSPRRPILSNQLLHLSNPSYIENDRTTGVWKLGARKVELKKSEKVKQQWRRGAREARSSGGETGARAMNEPATRRVKSDASWTRARSKQPHSTCDRSIARSTIDCTGVQVVNE